MQRSSTRGTMGDMADTIVFDSDDRRRGKEPVPLTKWQRAYIGFEVAQKLALLCAAVVVTVFVVKIYPNVTGLTAQVASDYPKTMAVVNGIMDNVDGVVANVTAKSPAMLALVDGATQALPADRLDALVRNVLILVTKIAAQNVTALAQVAEELLTRFSAIAGQDVMELKIAVPLAGRLRLP